MNHYSKTQLRKGAVKAARPAKASSSPRKGKGVSHEEAALLLGTEPPAETKQKK